MVITDSAKKEIVDELKEIYQHNQLELCQRIEIVVKQIKPSGNVALSVDNLNGSALDPRALGILLSKFP